jgi:hypothetical protein
MQDAVAEQLDDMRRLLGTVIGQQNDFLQNRQDLSPRQRRMEDMLRRVLYRMGDELPEDYNDGGHIEEIGSPDKVGSWYKGNDGSIYSAEIRPKYKTPGGSPSSTERRRQSGRPSPIPSELLDPYGGSPDFDDDLAIDGLPLSRPPSDYILPAKTIPPHMAGHLQRHQNNEPQHPTQARVESVYTEEAYSEDRTSPPSEMQPPIPMRPPPPLDDDEHSSSYDEFEIARNPARPLPPPKPVDLPTPVGSRENLNMHGSGPGPSIRPGYPGMSQYGNLPPPPGVAQMPRPSMPRIAGQRDPISTT